ncbi:hypothetical protein BV22DRAFT_1092976, partial [Leucogyrophana mollusca]
GVPLRHEPEAWRIAISPDGGRIASESVRGKIIRVWNAETGVQNGEPLLGRERDISCVAITINDELRVVHGNNN